jgi:hypothetical protein
MTGYVCPEVESDMVEVTALNYVNFCQGGSATLTGLLEPVTKKSGFRMLRFNQTGYGV